MISEKPLLMSGPMVRPTLVDAKILTRRTRGLDQFNESPDAWKVIRPMNRVEPLLAGGTTEFPGVTARSWLALKNPDGITDDGYQPITCPYGAVGDRLWVRETALYLRPIAGDDSIGDVMYADHDDYDICYPPKPNGKKGRRQTITSIDLGWRVSPSIFMPRWASRLTLEITSLRVERLQEISGDDAQAEGINMPPSFAVAAFRELWNSLNAKRGFGWDVNPWVWVIGFKRVLA